MLCKLPLNVSTRVPECGDVIPHSGPSERRITILGTPVGTSEFVLKQLESQIGEHATFLSRILAIQDLQCAWLLLLYCVARANFLLRTISPDLSLDFAIWDCFCSLVGVDPTAVQWSSHAAASLPVASGGLGLRSAVKSRYAAHWGMKMIRDRHPEIARHPRRKRR